MNRFIKNYNALALIGFPASLLVLNAAGGAFFAIGMLLGLIVIPFTGKDALKLNRHELIFFSSISLLVITALFSAYANDVDLERLDRLIILLLAIPVYLVFRNNLPNEALFWSGLVVGAVVCGVVALFQSMGSTDVFRAGGSTHPITFGNISLTMGMMSLAGSSWFTEKNKWWIIFPLLAAAFGILASLLSLSRGGWLAMPIIFILIVALFSNRISFKMVLSAAVLFVVAIVIVYNTPAFKVQKRVDSTLKNLTQYIESTDVNDPVRSSSVGTRLEMWRTSWYIIQQHPWAGVGWGAYRDHAQMYVDKGLVNQAAANYPHPHNQFISALAKGGILGLFAVLFLFGYSLVVFIKLFKSPESNAQVKRFALAGLVFLCSFIIYSISEAIFERSRIVTFFAFYLVVTMAFLTATQQDQTD